MKDQVRNIWMITREYGEIAGAGGVKDVVAQLSRALARWHGRNVQVVLPLYGFMEKETLELTPLMDPQDHTRPLQFHVRMDYAHEERKELVHVFSKKDQRVQLYFIESPRFTEKLDIYTYTLDEEHREPWQRHGEGHIDYFAMNVLLQKAALQLILYLGAVPDIMHCHDGHAALISALVQESDWLRPLFRTCGFLTTIHNAGIGYHQDISDLDFTQAITGFPSSVLAHNLLGTSFDPLVAAARYGLVNTVSENYARELQETEEDARTGWLGHHLVRLGFSLEGVTNGVDPEVLDPRKGRSLGLVADFDPRDDEAMSGKTLCKADFWGMLGPERDRRRVGRVEQYGYLAGDGNRPLFTCIGRITEQKGVDILVAAMRNLMQNGHSSAFAILGSGIESVEGQIFDLLSFPGAEGNVCFLKGYDAELATKLYAAGDFFVIPSRYEPCGLTDFIAQLFANIPLVHHVGGLVKVRDGETGFAYHKDDPCALSEKIDMATRCWHDKGMMRMIQKEAVALIEKRYTWKIVKEEYLRLYRRAREYHVSRWGKSER